MTPLSHRRRRLLALAVLSMAAAAAPAQTALRVGSKIDTEGSLLGNLINYANALSSQVQAGNAQASQQLQGVNSQIGAIGRFLGWQFYQLPNRYSSYIPNQGPGGSQPVGSSVIGSV